uniref:Malonyl-CoA/methylmalonyl-CoA synthetase n=1 Tax=Rhipicephalus zambeziensis TaxID=60191 RepID=A0A224YSX6_9ACAR
MHIRSLQRNMTFLYFARLQGSLANNFRSLQKLKLGSLSSIRCSSTTFPPAFSPVFGGIQEHVNKLAVVDALGSHTYGDLLSFSQQIQKEITKLTSSCDQMRISYLCPSDVRYVATQWACWLGGNVAVPLYHQHPDAMLEYYIKDSQTSILLTTKEYKERIVKLSEQLSLPYVVIDRPSKEKAEGIESKDWESLKEQDALMMYTSGTTGPPKGVVLSFRNVHFQVAQIRKAWEWTPEDVMLHALPLHHTHGIISGLLTPLYSRAACLMLPKFNPAEVWKHLLHLDKSKPAVSVFMAVPTMYVKLIEHYEQHLRHCKETAPDVVRDTFAKNIRFVISGSASLPQPIFEKFHDITGMTILERYGMTEVGVPLSNLLHGKRHPGCVGYPTAGVEVCIAEADDSKIGYKPLVLSANAETKYLEGSENNSGELLIRGPNVFKYYWNRPEVTKDSFTQDGWFKTGDSAACTDGVYKILGRTSADIIKSGGYKVSALDVERHLLAHPSIKECTVVGAPDATWGERVAAIVVLHEPSATLELEDLRNWCKERMPTYNVPSILLCVPALERNFLGKVNKKELVKKLWPAPQQ